MENGSVIVKEGCGNGFSSSFAIENGLQKKLKVSSSAYGTLSLLQEGHEDAVDYEITKGETIACVENFGDDIITVTFSLTSAVAGDKFCVQYA